MTQVLGMIFSGFAFQGSDRRLSIGPRVDPASEHANKSLVVSTGESISLVGYTGLAELDLPPHGRVQMDSFLAGASCHTPTWPWKPPTSANDLGSLHVGQVVQRLSDWLTLLHEHSDRNVRSHLESQMVQLVGFRRHRRRYAKPYSFVLSWQASIRRFGYTSEKLFASQWLAPQITLTPTRSKDSKQRLADFLAGFTEDPETMSEGFARSLLGFTGILGVGGEFLILMLDPLEFTVYVDFVSDSDNYPVAVTQDGDVPVVPLPWHVGPRSAVPPVLTNVDSGGGWPHLRFLVPFEQDGSVPFVKFELERVRRLGPQRYELPGNVVSLDIELPAGRHTIELFDRPDPSKHL